jgi:hypothetical protein
MLFKLTKYFEELKTEEPSNGWSNNHPSNLTHMSFMRGDSLGMTPIIRSGTLHHNCVLRLAMHVLFVVANAESSSIGGTRVPLLGHKPSHGQEDDYEDEDGLWDNIWEYVLEDDKVDEPCCEENDSTQQQSRRFRLRFWEADDDDDDYSTSGEKDRYDEQASVSGFAFKLDNWRESYDENDT